MYYIYELTSPSGTVYIGQTNDIRHRWAQYRQKNSSVKDQPALWNALNKYPNFREWTTRVLYTYQTQQAVDIAEKILIKLNKMKGVDSYNIAAGGEGVGSGVDHPNYDHSCKYGVNWCEDAKAYRKAHYTAHREEALDYRRAYYNAHREEALDHRRAYRATHREKELAYDRARNAERSLICKANNLTQREFNALPKEQRAHLREVFRNRVPS